MPNQITTDAIKFQLNSLVPTHNYSTKFTIFKGPEHESKLVTLDKNEFNFRAFSTVQNVFVLLTKEIDVEVIVLEVLTTDLTDSTSGSSSLFLRCSGYNPCKIS